VLIVFFELIATN